MGTASKEGSGCAWGGGGERGGVHLIGAGLVLSLAVFGAPLYRLLARRNVVLLHNISPANSGCMSRDAGQMQARYRANAGRMWLSFLTGKSKEIC